MSDIEAEAAIDVVALQVIANVVTDQVGELWESYPDIGEDATGSAW